MQKGPHRKGGRRVAGHETHEEGGPSGLIRFSGTDQISGNIKNRQNPIFSQMERKKVIRGGHNSTHRPFLGVLWISSLQHGLEFFLFLSQTPRMDP